MVDKDDEMIPRLLACLLYASLFSFAAHASPLFTEDFNVEISVKGRHRQAQTDLPIKHGYDAMPGWTRLGEGMPAHFVEHTPGDWALMVVAREPNQNVFTQNKGFAANDMGHTYTVSFDVGPAVYQGLSQVTTAEEQLAIELLRTDGTGQTSPNTADHSGSGGMAKDRAEPGAARGRKPIQRGCVRGCAAATERQSEILEGASD